MLRFALAVLLVSPIVCLGQARTPIEVDHSGTDQVGQLFAFELKEAIRGSQGMYLVSNTPQARVRIILVSLDTTFGSNKGFGFGNRTNTAL